MDEKKVKKESLMKRFGKGIGAGVLALATVLPFVPNDAHAAGRIQEPNQMSTTVYRPSPEQAGKLAQKIENMRHQIDHMNFNNERNDFRSRMNVKNFKSQYGDPMNSNANISNSHIKGKNVRIGGINEGRDR